MKFTSEALKQHVDELRLLIRAALANYLGVAAATPSDTTESDGEAVVADSVGNQEEGSPNPNELGTPMTAAMDVAPAAGPST